MSPPTVELEGKMSVIVERKEYLRLKRSADILKRQDAGDIAEAERRIADGSDKVQPYSRTRKRLRLP